jgi:hypothetical protein
MSKNVKRKRDAAKRRKTQERKQRTAIRESVEAALTAKGIDLTRYSDTLWTPERSAGLDSAFTEVVS